MLSTREAILTALFGRLQTLSGPTVLKNDDFPARIPDGGLIILRDGTPGEPEITMSPLRYYWTHSTPLDVAVQIADPASRDVAFDALLQDIASVLASDPTLGGLCDYAEPGAPDTEMIALEGASGIKGAIVPIIMAYETKSQLG